MKNYLDFTLTGKKLFPVWILFYLLFLAPYSYIILQFHKYDEIGGHPPVGIFVLLFLIVLLAYFVMFYLIKMTIENLEYRGIKVAFSGSFAKFIGTVLLGILLTIITVGIYAAWFIRDLERFFVNNSSYQLKQFEFKGKGGKLFIILLLTLLPVILISALTGYLMALSAYSGHALDTDYSGHGFSAVLMQFVIFLIMIPYMYYVYKWMVNIDYGMKNISWETEFWPSAGKIFIEIFLSLITLGIYSPLACVKLYKYFADRTKIIAPESKQTFGYDIEPGKDFLFLWGQILITIVTLGIYFAWAHCKILKRILGKTYITE